MRLHISLDDHLVKQLDDRVGRRHRSAFIAETIRRALDDERRWEDIESAFGSIPAEGHEWDAAPGAWVTSQRTGDARRVG